MRTTILLLAVAVLVVAVLAACRPRDESASDSAAPDSVPADDTAADVAAVPNDTAPASATRPTVPRTPREARPASAATRDSALPPDDSVRAMRPDVPQVTPPKRPRTWRGFKLPEEMPVRTPVDTIKTLAPSESLMKGDSTKAPPPDR